MSMYSPLVSRTSSQARGPRPLSITCVKPPSRGPRPRSKVGNELLQLLLRAFLDVVEERVAVGVDPDPQRAEVLDPELPQALRHQVFPRDLLDFFDLRRLERGRAADDREIDHSEPAHRLDRLVREAALAADRADAVFGAERLGEPHHPRAGRRSDAERLVVAGPELADIRRSVEQERSGKVERRLLALVEDPDLRAVADPDDVAVDRDEVARAQLADLLLGRRKCQMVFGHQNSRSKSTSPSALTCAEARRAAQHW